MTSGRLVPGQAYTMARIVTINEIPNLNIAHNYSVLMTLETGLETYLQKVLYRDNNKFEFP